MASSPGRLSSRASGRSPSSRKSIFSSGWFAPRFSSSAASASARASPLSSAGMTSSVRCSPPASFSASRSSGFGLTRRAAARLTSSSAIAQAHAAHAKTAHQGSFNTPKSAISSAQQVRIAPIRFAPLGSGYSRSVFLRRRPRLIASSPSFVYSHQLTSRRTPSPACARSTACPATVRSLSPLARLRRTTCARTCAREALSMRG